MRRNRRPQPAGPARPTPEAPFDLEIPPVLPVIRVAVRAADDVEITVDGQLWVAGPIDRASLGRVLGTIVAEREVPVRVEITEADGRRFADIITPIARRSPFAPPAPQGPEPADPTATLRRVEARGFVPGEDVAVAIITRSTSADGHGIAHALIDETQVPEHALGVILFGFVSGTTIHDRLRP